MKKYIAIIIGSMFLIVGLIVNPVVAVENHKIYEMGESGQIVSFLMTEEEISAEDLKNERFAAIRESKDDKQKQRRKIFEMGESSQIVSFPMTAEEIAVEDAKMAQLKTLNNSKVLKEGSEVVTLELAESGEIIEFRVKSVEILTEGVAKTGVEMNEDKLKKPNG